jgi:hypothetical protein
MVRYWWIFLKLITTDKNAKRNVLLFRDYVFPLIFNYRPKCRMMNHVISFGARNTGKKMLTFFEFPCSNTAGNLLVVRQMYPPTLSYHTDMQTASWRDSLIYITLYMAKEDKRRRPQNVLLLYFSRVRLVTPVHVLLLLQTFSPYQITGGWIQYWTAFLFDLKQCLVIFLYIIK